MYWKVQKIGPEQLIRAYGVHILLGVSVIINGFLFLTMPKGNKVSSETKQTIDAFVRDVTNHLLDTSYINCEKNVMELRKELAPNVFAAMAQRKEVPGTNSELIGLIRDMSERKQVCAVRVDKVTTGDPDNRGMIPVEVQGVCALHSSQDTGETNFRFRYLIGQHAETKAFLIADFHDETPVQP
ncbi:MAG: hypothetical protein LCH63_12840 [Candidatus Melainabacteria bacterium]|nr:hypothetical protein [Candidatus Melainabacteria bacterium]